MEKEEKSAYIEVLDYNRIVSFHDNQSLKEAIKRDLEEDLKQEGFEFSDIILQVQSTDEKFGGKFIDLRDQDVPDQAVIRGKLRQHKKSVQCSTSENIAGVLPTQSDATSTFPQSPPILLGPTCSSHLRQMRFGSAMNLLMPKEGDSDPSSHTTDEEIIEQAKIYRKQDLRPLSDHQKAINDVAGVICLENPAMLLQRKNLYEQAQERVHEEGFAYKKGKSRSKKFSNPQSSSKRPKIDGQIRTLRMTEIQDDIKSFKESIKFKERRRSQAESSREYKVCEDLTVEIREHQRKIRELEAEIKLYEAKEKKSKGYHRRKSLTQKSPSPLSSESEASRRGSEQSSLRSFCSRGSSDSNPEPTSSRRSSLSDLASSQPSQSQVNKNNVQHDSEETITIESDFHESPPSSPASVHSPTSLASPFSPPLTQSFARASLYREATTKIIIYLPIVF